MYLSGMNEKFSSQHARQALHLQRVCSCDKISQIYRGRDNICPVSGLICSYPAQMLIRLKKSIKKPSGSRPLLKRLITRRS